MKRFSLLLAVVLLFSCFNFALADDFDLSHVRENPDIFSIDVNIEEDVAFIETLLDAESRSFVHKYDSSTRYSTTQFDMIVIDYTKSSCYPVFRLWFTYCADDNYMNITSITFTLDGKNYTFSEVASTDRYYQDENGYQERMLIKFDLDNADFLVALESMVPDTAEGFDTVSIPVTLHGRENVNIVLGKGFMLDFFVMKNALIKCNGIDYLSEAIGTPVKITNAR